MRCRRYTASDARRLMPRLRLPRGVTPAALAVGMNVEREHADLVGCSPLAHAMIAAAHFREDKDYYRKLLPCVEGKPYREGHGASSKEV